MVFRFTADLDTMTWIQPRVSGVAPLARNAQTMTVVGTKLFLFGGHSGNKHLRDLHILDTETMTWSQPEVRLWVFVCSMWA
jgi:N-acetylneuraminic acid mutarotase